ncbi:MAG: peptidoglycan DD-metalloendopeptidase family protein [Alphaproteobacteria bacterium]
MARLAEAASRATEPREIMMRARGRVVFVRLSRPAQFFCLFVLGSIVGGLGYVSASYIKSELVIAHKDRQLVWLTERSVSLSARVESMSDDVTFAAGTIERGQQSLVGLLAQNKALLRDVARLQERLRNSDSRRANQIRRQAQLHDKLGDMERDLDAAERKKTSLASSLESTKSTLAEAMAERTAIENARNSMKNRVASLQQNITEARENQVSTLSRVTDYTAGDIRRMRKLVRITGLDPDKLLRAMDPGLFGTGGPFVPVNGNAAKNDDAPIESLGRNLQQWQGLQNVLRLLPLVSPVDHYQLASRFGRRRDPINRRLARHQGLDLAALNRMPVYAPAPGKVTFRGWKGRYGRFIEIDHGNGIRTRYGHLRRIYVKRGQVVPFRFRIGQVGSSGRSTGPHVHYEILVNGKAVDPMKFIKAGQNVFKG